MSKGAMTGIGIKRGIMVMAACVAMATGVWLGIAVEASRPELVEQKTVVVEPISEGVETGEVYSVEIWDNGEARIMTTVPHIQQIDEHTIVVTDKDMGDVIEDIEAAIERGDVQ